MQLHWYWKTSKGVTKQAAFRVIFMLWPNLRIVNTCICHAWSKIDLKCATYCPMHIGQTFVDTVLITLWVYRKWAIFKIKALAHHWHQLSEFGPHESLSNHLPLIIGPQGQTRCRPTISWNLGTVSQGGQVRVQPHGPQRGDRYSRPLSPIIINEHKACVIIDWMDPRKFEPKAPPTPPSSVPAEGGGEGVGGCVNNVCTVIQQSSTVTDTRVASISIINDNAGRCCTNIQRRNKHTNRVLNHTQINTNRSWMMVTYAYL